MTLANIEFMNDVISCNATESSEQHGEGRPPPTLLVPPGGDASRFLLQVGNLLFILYSIDGLISLTDGWEKLPCQEAPVFTNSRDDKPMTEAHYPLCQKIQYTYITIYSFI